MDDVVYKEFLHDAAEAARHCSAGGMAVVGESDVCAHLVADLDELGASTALGPVVCWIDGQMSPADRDRLSAESVEVVMVGSDRHKERIVRALPGLVSGTPRVLVAGYDHLRFHDSDYELITQELSAPSLANGYPDCRVHLFQCLRNAARLQLEGVIVEFGMFRGGTTQFLAEASNRLGANYPVVGLDTFDGFPERRHIFDMYSHPDLFDVNLDEVRHRLREYPIEIVPGDIVATAERALKGKQVVLAFIDTDNYSSGKAAISAVIDRVVVGGAIVLDHFTGQDRFNQTLGERLAAQDLLLDDSRYFNLHGTGVFVRQARSQISAA